jgi:hypothetical protein
MKTVIGVAILILFTILHNTFRLLLANGHKMNKEATFEKKISFG